MSARLWEEQQHHREGRRSTRRRKLLIAAELCIAVPLLLYLFIWSPPQPADDAPPAAPTTPTPSTDRVIAPEAQAPHFVAGPPIKNRS